MTPTSGRLAEIWKILSERQKRYVLACQNTRSRKDAAIAIGLTPYTVYRWPKYVNEAADLYVDHAAEAAMAELTQALAKAALGKVREMDSADESLAARARTEILDRGLGKAVQKHETSVKGRFDVSSERMDDLTTALAERAAAFVDDEGSAGPGTSCNHCAGDCTSECGAEDEV